MNETVNHKISRRTFLRASALGTVAVASASMPGCRDLPFGERRLVGPATRVLRLDRDWRFGGKFTEAATQPQFNDHEFQSITLPHCVTPLSWRNWDPASWEDTWIYRRSLEIPRSFQGLRVFLNFEGVMMGATPVINGHALPQHLGGYLPFQYEVTGLLRENPNLLTVAVDSHWLNVPPTGSPRGPKAVDYLIPGGITRAASLRAVPSVFIKDVFAKPVEVLEPRRRVEVKCVLDAASIPTRPTMVHARLMKGLRVVADSTQAVHITQKGEIELQVTLENLGNIRLWDVEHPELYEVVVTFIEGAEAMHTTRTRLGFRDARFDLDGFFLNGRRLQLFGLDRHEIYPYVGNAMPARVLRRDAEILRRQFNCNAVRCSHYPQSEAFLDACDELGLLVWEEIPGWQYIGDASWQDLAVRDVKDMVLRDRNHPSIVIWGVRINESANDPAFYSRTKAAAKALDDSRPTSGAMNRYSTKDWLQDVYAFDDYHSAPDGSVGLRDPLPGVPYFLAEAVGQFEYGTGRGFGRKYRRGGDLDVQRRQALAHAQVHSKAGSNPRFGGVVAWCAFDYASLMNCFEGIKCPGVADIFRIPKLGAAFYLAQVSPQVRPVLEPNFYWDFGPQSPSGPGKGASIFSNAERLEVFVGGLHIATAFPDTANFPNLQHAPFFVDLELDGAGKPELRIDAYVGTTCVLSRSFCSDASTDQLFLKADDSRLVADGVDATRLVFRAVDRFGAARPFVDGNVSLAVTGPGIIVGDNPFPLGENGGAGAVWLKTALDRPGRIRVSARHARLGERSVELRSVRPVENRF